MMISTLIRMSLMIRPDLCSDIIMLSGIKIENSIGHNRWFFFSISILIWKRITYNHDDDGRYCEGGNESRVLPQPATEKYIWKLHIVIS